MLQMDHGIHHNLPFLRLRYPQMISHADVLPGLKALSDLAITRSGTVPNAMDAKTIETEVS